MRIGLLLLVAVGCSSKNASTPLVSAPPAEALVIPGVENAFRVTPKLFSGGTPVTDAAFAELRSRGITTIISVDGATPDVDKAAKHGLTYVHLPIGYDGIGLDTAYKLARATEVAPGPVYVHCHHGKHRGPTAVAVIRLCLEPDYTVPDARAWLTQAGTDPKFKGLIDTPRTLKRPQPGDLAKLPKDFPTAVEVKPLTRIMVNVDLHWDAVTELKAKSPAAAEGAAVLLVEDYREMGRSPPAITKGEAFLVVVTQAETAAKQLADAAKANNAGAFDAAYSASKALCATCHGKYRD